MRRSSEPKKELDLPVCNCVRELNVRNLKYGSENHILAVAYLLHSCYEGALLGQECNFDLVNNKLFHDYPTTVTYNDESRLAGNADSAFILDNEDDPMEELLATQRGTQLNTDSPKLPDERELINFMAIGFSHF